MSFDKFVIWTSNEKLSWRDVWCNIRERGIVWKCIYVLFEWKMIEKLSCVSCEFIPLEYEEGNII
jgi:hypothetical protein